MQSNDNLPWFVRDPLKAIQCFISPKRFVALDFETTNRDKGSALDYNNHIVLACWWVVTEDGITKKSAFADEYELGELERDIKDAEFVIAHNAKFELQWLKRMGMELRDVLVFDTYLAEWLIRSNLGSPTTLSLEATSQRYKLGSKLALGGMLIKSGVCASKIPKEWLEPYCHRDTELGYELYKLQVNKLDALGLMPLLLTRVLCCACLADIEFNGGQLDPERVRKEYDSTVEKYTTLKKELAELTGNTNLNSPKQLAALLYGDLGFSPPLDPKTKLPIKTRTGTLATDSATLSKLSAQTEEQIRFLDLYKRINKASSLLSKNLKFFMGVVEDYSGSFFGVLNQGFTNTGRLSSSGRKLLFKKEKKERGAQLQNLPREYKPLFVAAEDGWLCGEADGAQLEFRVGADMSNDLVATEEIERGEDIHSHTMAVLVKAKEPSVVSAPPESRRQASKSHTFAPINLSGLVRRRALNNRVNSGKVQNG